MTQPTPPAALSSADLALRQRRFLALGLMAALSMLCGIIAGVMVALCASDVNLTPPDSPRLVALREAVAKNPGDAALQQALRQEDRHVRQRYFTLRRRFKAGAWLLLVGAFGLICCARWYATADPATPWPLELVERTNTDKWLAGRRYATAGVACAAGIVVAGFIILAGAGGPSLPPLQKSPAPAAIPPPPAPPAPPKPATPPGVAQPDENHSFKENWPWLRGANAGVVRSGDYPTTWDPKTGQNILWKTNTPGIGQSSPLVWGNRLFLTCGYKKKREVVCYERSSGKLLWRAEIQTPADARKALEEAELDVPSDTTYAAPTPATDGERVYVTFATADLAAVDFDGKVLWVKNLGVPDNAYGRASSLIAYKDRVIIQNDDGMGGPESKSALLAFDGKTGEVAWRTPRETGATWSSPIIVKTPAGPQIITMAEWTKGYEPEFGTEIWRAGGISGEIAPSPAYADGIAYVTNEYSIVMAVKVDGTGDVGETHVVWEAEEGLADTSSPVATAKHFMQAHSGGEVTCYDAKSGKLRWSHDYEDAFYASIVAAGDVAYLFGEEGHVYLVKLADTFEQVAHVEMGEELHATPAFADSQIYMRTNKHLYCIGKKDGVTRNE